MNIYRKISVVFSNFNNKLICGINFGNLEHSGKIKNAFSSNKRHFVMVQLFDLHAVNG